MRISATSLKEIGALVAGQGDAAPAVPSGEEVALDKVPTQDGYVPSAELVRLTVLARQEPELRADVVREVARRVSEGRYLTTASAAQTAEAMLAGIE